MRQTPRMAKDSKQPATDDEPPGSRLPVPPKMPLEDYERELVQLQIELLKVQRG